MDKHRHPRQQGQHCRVERCHFDKRRVRRPFRPIGLIATATVDGAGSSWFNNAMAITVGSNGSATLTISNGGTVTSAGGNITNGQVTATDAASRWFTQDLVVGPGGTGALNIQNGGKVFSNSGTIADLIGTTGQVTVTGADSSWRTAEEIFVGNSGTGSLNILNGGVVSNFGAVGVIVGNFNGSTGTVTVSGAGSTLSIARSLLLGGQGFVGGTGIVTIQNGGVISTPQVNIAPSAASVGTLNIGAAVGAAPAAWNAGRTERRLRCRHRTDRVQPYGHKPYVCAADRGTWHRAGRGRHHEPHGEQHLLRQHDSQRRQIAGERLDRHLGYHGQCRRHARRRGHASATPRSTTARFRRAIRSAR